MTAHTTRRPFRWSRLLIYAILILAALFYLLPEISK